MASKALDSKHEKILRGLCKQPENKRCINCETLGPSYIVPDLKIFICTTCSGIHRNFGHRVKSISLATFTPTEVKNMQEGGNLVAEATYLARWTPRDLPKPTDRTEASISKWIETVYKDLRFYSSINEASHQTKEVANHQSHSSSANFTVADSDGPSLIDFETPKAAKPTPAAPDKGSGASSGWAAFMGDSAKAPAAAPAAAVDSFWSSFDAPAAAIPQPAAAAPSNVGWSAFDTPAAQPPAAAATAGNDWLSYNGSSASQTHAEPKPPSTASSRNELPAAPTAGNDWSSFAELPASQTHAEPKPPPAASSRKELPTDLFAMPEQPAFPSYGAPTASIPPYGAPPAGIPQYGAPSSGIPGQYHPPSTVIPQYGSAPMAAGPYGAPPVPASGGIFPAHGASPVPIPGGNPFASASLTAPSTVGSFPAPVPQFGAPLMASPGHLQPVTGSSGNPFSLVAGEKPKNEVISAFDDLLPAFSSALPSSKPPNAFGGATHNSNVGVAASVDSFSSFGGPPAGSASFGAFGGPAAPPSSDPFASFGGMATAAPTPLQSSDPFGSYAATPASHGFGGPQGGFGGHPGGNVGGFGGPQGGFSHPQQAGYGGVQQPGGYGMAPAAGQYGAHQVPGGNPFA